MGGQAKTCSSEILNGPITSSSAIKRKSKMVSFRLSHEEYEFYRQACSTVGCRSLSELARAAMQQLTGTRNGDAPLDDRLREIKEQIQYLSLEVERIARKSKIQKATAATESDLEGNL